MEGLILLGLILLNGLFAMSEIALLTARRSRLSSLADKGDTAAATALRLGEEPTRFLSAVQVGITSIGILSGIVGESVLAAPMAAWLTGLGVDEDTAGVIAMVVVVLSVTYVSIVVGELAPKRLGQLNPERIARLVARPIHLLATVARPFVMLLSISTDALLRLLGVRQRGQAGVTQDDITALLKEGADSGTIEQQQHAMLRNVFHLDNRLVGSMMVPRADIVFVDVTHPYADNLRTLIESPYSSVPVCRDGFDEVLGVIHAKQALAVLAANQSLDFERDVQPCTYVLESLTGFDLLQLFRKNAQNFALVVDEYGEIEGLITLHDILEAVAGGFEPQTEADNWALQREDGSWLLDGALPIPELKDLLGLQVVPEEQRARYHTLSGLISVLLGRMPVTGSQVQWEGWRFEVVDMDGMRIDKVLASRLQADA